MTVLLVGIGADTTNCRPTPPVYDDGRFEYIPIPERTGPDGTTEERTYGNTTLKHAEGPLASFVETIFPTGRSGARVSDTRLSSWPLHFDPNLESLTYGETASRAAYVKRIRQLSAGDVVAFYTGLQAPEGGGRHRYLIGAFTVNEVVDFRRISHRGAPTSFSALPDSTQDAIMHEHPENAHAKRYFARGEITANQDGLVIVDGMEPGGLFSRALRISHNEGGPHHYLRDTFEDRWSPAPNGRDTTNAYLGGVKPAHLLDVSPEAFWEDVDPLF